MHIWPHWIFYSLTVIRFVLVLVMAAGPLPLITDAVRLLLLVMLLLLLPSYWCSCLCAATDNPLHCTLEKDTIIRIYASRVFMFSRVVMLVA